MPCWDISMFYIFTVHPLSMWQIKFLNFESCSASWKWASRGPFTDDGGWGEQKWKRGLTRREWNAIPDCLPPQFLSLSLSLSHCISSVTGKSVHLSKLPFISQRVARLLSTEAWSRTHPSGKPFCLGGEGWWDGSWLVGGGLGSVDRGCGGLPSEGITAKQWELATDYYRIFTVSDQNNPPHSPRPFFLPPQLAIIGYSEDGLVQRDAGSIGKAAPGWLAFGGIRNNDKKKHLQGVFQRSAEGTRIQ